MNDDLARGQPPDTMSFEGQIDRLCERFEAAWKSGQRPRIEDYLELDCPPEGAAPVRELLVELVKVDLDYRWRFGSQHQAHEEASKASDPLPRRPRMEDYVARHPALGPLEELSEELIVAEYRARHRWGDKPSHNEYLTRFGSQRESLLETLCRTDEELALRKKKDSDREAAVSRPEQHQGLHVRCPHCRNPIEIVDDTPVAEINCPSCGSSFNLVGEEALTLQTLGGTRRRRRVLGHFELIEQLGSGAFGAVWKARDTQLDRIVAIKTPRKGQLDREETEKVLREARAAAQLRHPNIVSVHEVGLDGDLLYMVSDFIEGVTLNDWLSGQKFTHREAAELCAKVADAIHFAHEQGVIHRDLKPSNIMLDSSGEPHLMDFGLAKREAGEITMTMDGQILGTPAYMSPEQAKGEGHTADRRADVYSLGVILFELLTGECPFRGNVQMLIKQVSEDNPPKPRTLDSTIPRDLETICLKCLEKEPNRRYLSARDLSEELHRFLRGELIRARPTGLPIRVWRWCRRNPALAGLSSSVGLMLLFSFLTIAAWVNNSPPPTAYPRSTPPTNNKSISENYQDPLPRSSDTDQSVVSRTGSDKGEDSPIPAPSSPPDSEQQTPVLDKAQPKFVKVETLQRSVLPGQPIRIVLDLTDKSGIKEVNVGFDVNRNERLDPSEKAKPIRNPAPDGKWHVELPTEDLQPGRYDVLVVAVDMQGFTGQKRQPVVIASPVASSTIVGQTVFGKLALRATVLLKGKEYSDETISGLNGQFVFRNVPHGKYTIEAQGIMHNVSVNGSANITLPQAEERASVTVKLEW